MEEASLDLGIYTKHLGLLSPSPPKKWSPPSLCLCRKRHLGLVGLGISQGGQFGTEESWPRKG